MTMARFISRFGTPFFITYTITAMILLGLIETVFNGGFYFSLRILWLPLAIVIFGVTAYCHKDLPRGRNGKGPRWFPWVMAAVLYPLTLLMSWPYVLLVNALLPSRGPVTYAGPVIEKPLSGGRTTTYLIVLDDFHTGEPITLAVSREAYDKIPLGMIVDQTFTIGGLGIPYNWRFARSPKAH